MNGIGQAALEVQNRLNELNHSFCIIDGLAVVYWGTPRSTQDVDISLLVPLGQERTTAETLLESFSPRLENAAEFAEQSRMLLVRASNDVPIDIALAGFPLEQAMIERSTVCQLQPGLSLRLITAEDLIVTKVLANRPQDIADVQGILDRQGATLDRQFVRSELTAFCKLLETDEPIELLEKLFSD